MKWILGLIGGTPWAGPCLIYALVGLIALSAGLGALFKIRGAELETAQVQIKVLSADVKAQNDAVDELKKESDDQAKKLFIALEKKERTKEAVTKRVRAITVAEIPKECPKAIKWGAGFAKDFGIRWEGAK